MVAERRGVFRILFVLVIALVLGIGVSLAHTSSAQASPLNPSALARPLTCYDFDQWNQPQYAAYGIYLPCYSGNNFAAAGYAYFCAPGNYQYTRVNNDDWLTTQPWSGGVRYYESGRSGLLGIPNNCSFSYMTESYGNLSVTPLWGCSWFDFADYGVAYDYQCGYIEG